MDTVETTVVMEEGASSAVDGDSFVSQECAGEEDIVEKEDVSDGRCVGSCAAFAEDDERGDGAEDLGPTTAAGGHSYTGSLDSNCSNTDSSKGAGGKPPKRIRML